MNNGLEALDLDLLNADSEVQQMRMSALHEVANIGIGHAANSLSQLCNKDFKISVPKVFPISFDRMHELLPFGSSEYGVVYMAISGELTGRMAFFMDWSSCQALCGMLLGQVPEDSDSINELEYSSLIETGNIINGAFLSAFMEFTGVCGLATPPILAVDSFDAIIGSITAEAMNDHVALFIETRIWDANESIKGAFLFIPSQSSLDLIWEKFFLTEVA